MVSGTRGTLACNILVPCCWTRRDEAHLRSATLIMSVPVRILISPSEDGDSGVIRSTFKYLAVHNYGEAQSEFRRWREPKQPPESSPSCWKLLGCTLEPPSYSCMLLYCLVELLILPGVLINISTQITKTPELNIKTLKAKKWHDGTNKSTNGIKHNKISIVFLRITFFSDMQLSTFSLTEFNQIQFKSLYLSLRRRKEKQQQQKHLRPTKNDWKQFTSCWDANNPSK